MDIKKTKLFLHQAILMLCFMLSITCSLVVYGQNSVVNLPTNIPAPTINGSAWALMEFNSGWVVAGDNINTPVSPASITKLMTNYVVFEKLKRKQVSLNDQVNISEKSWRAEGSRMFAKVGSRIRLERLLKSTIIQSGNDAAIALAEHVAGSEESFVALMNLTARKLGLTGTHFMNSTGLPAEGHTMTAHDIVKLGAAIARDFPEYYPWYSEKEYTHNEITQFNRNKLLWKDPMIDGLKTGHTDDAGYCLLGSSEKYGVRWFAVVMGAESVKQRESNVMSVLRYAYAAFEPVEMFTEQGGVTQVPVYKGEVDLVNLQSKGSVHLVVPAGKTNELHTELQLSPYYVAPIDVGQAMGLAKVSLAGKSFLEVPLISMSAIKPGSVWKRALDSIKIIIYDYTNSDENQEKTE